MSAASHQNGLLAAGRCGWCAERIPRTGILRAGSCPICDSSLAWNGGHVLAHLETQRARWRLLGYGLVAAASFVAGAVPLLQVAVQVAAILVLHVIVLRRGLLWLPPGRRILARLAIKLLGAAIATAALLINVAVAPFVGVSAFVLAGVGLGLTAAYIEGGLVVLRQRLRWEAEGRSLAVVEWGLPLALLLTLLLAVAATAGVVVGTLHVLSTAQVPAVSELATTLLEVAQ